MNSFGHSKNICSEIINGIFAYKITYQTTIIIKNFKQSTMKFVALILALVATASAGAIEQKNAVSYTYEDIREQELKCKADRNREWKYDAATNTWACPLQRYD